MEKNVWSSLPVPCVQELAKEVLTTVPPRYVRTDLDSPVIADATFPPQVPVIDLQKLLSGDLTNSELDKLHHACKEWGFFQLINHGVSSSLVEKMKIEAQELFNLPMEEKKKYWQKEGDVEGFGQAFVVSEEQKLDWADLFLVTALPIHLRKPHLFSKLPLPFRETLEAYSVELRDLAMKILNQMAKALGMESEYVKELFEEGRQNIRVNYYPPCPQPELAIGINPHSDGGGLTVLLQINEVNGLQIKKNGMWVPVKPLPGAFIINIGNILEIVTNGIYQSIEHRATVNSMKERLSIATFYSAKLDGNIGPAPSLITPETPALYKTMSVADYYKGFFSRQLQGKSYLDALKVKNENE
ncbi:protein SRG1-like [Mangifera indica]|uniref:protein SRG1-like n=1 Tax=Mangifera indica TaxID=29780 RepID=UPI001CFABF82|nr:protein SRG1-like [Mangifera indica]